MFVKLCIDFVTHPMAALAAARITVLQGVAEGTWDTNPRRSRLKLERALQIAERHWESERWFFRTDALSLTVNLAELCCDLGDRDTALQYLVDAQRMAEKNESLRTFFERSGLRQRRDHVSTRLASRK